MALNGYYVERMLMAKFVNLSRDLPLIDVGGNLGIVTLQAALQGRQVVAVEPIPENALRLCRAVVDFGHAHLVHVMQNAASSQEGNVTLAMDRPKGRARYGVIRSETWGYEQTAAYAIHLDRLLELIPFRTAALKIDVESHEGHVLAGAERLFQEVDIPIVWMEWEHVKRRPEYGGAFIVQFMQRHNLVPCDLMSGLRLPTENYRNWPRTNVFSEMKSGSSTAIRDWKHTGTLQVSRRCSVVITVHCRSQTLSPILFKGSCDFCENQ
ncbi:uncharacterized protein LOC143296554 [Babylonia areolata]|uniref:uncharacterized protein LOC143296554 n=1 Tax=Babylonia areolata TaxID=304850 RepID=UPI003FD488C3